MSASDVEDPGKHDWVRLLALQTGVILEIGSGDGGLVETLASAGCRVVSLRDGRRLAAYPGRRLRGTVLRGASVEHFVKGPTLGLEPSRFATFAPRSPTPRSLPGHPLRPEFENAPFYETLSVLGALDDPPFVAASFDGVVCVDLLDRDEEAEAGEAQESELLSLVLGAAASLLRPGGRLVVSAPGPAWFGGGLPWEEYQRRFGLAGFHCRGTYLRLPGEGASTIVAPATFEVIAQIAARCADLAADPFAPSARRAVCERFSRIRSRNELLEAAPTFLFDLEGA